jgi:transcriptional regulator with XRE-family HTH domain
MPFFSRKATLSLADSVRRILATRNLSLAEVSRASRASGNRLAHVPHSFYSSLRKQSFSPSLYQLRSLSRLSRYHLEDWLALFGIDLDHVSRFQVSFPSVRTVELDDTIYRPALHVPWLYDLNKADLRNPLTPLSQWVALGLPQRTDSLARGTESAFRYVKIGSHDALAFPDLLPGSVVRVKNGSAALKRTPIGKSLGRTLFLVRHIRGITCSRLFQSELDKIVLCSGHLPYAPIELSLDGEGEVLGTADLEFRVVAQVPKPVVTARSERFRAPVATGRPVQQNGSGDFIRRARIACGISFRDASERTRVIARELGDRRYYCSPGALSDYETRNSAPRHIHKLISICAVYFARVADFLAACGAPLDKADTCAMPPEFLRESLPSQMSSRKPFDFLREVRRRLGPLPWFLRDAGSSLFGLPNISLRDVFWVGDLQEPKYSCLAGIQFLIVDRRQKKPRASLSSPIWAQPLYVLQKRGGGYLWGFCRLEGGTISLCYPPQPARSIRLRNGIDAEMVGRVVGVIRRLT